MSYDETVMKDYKRSRGVLERIKLLMPGYRGYRNKNVRRDVDKEVRSEVARQFDNCKTVMIGLKGNFVAKNDMETAKELERIIVKTDTYISDMESAEAGYSAAWEVNKTLNGDLDEVMEWDAKLLEEAEELKTALKDITSKADAGENVMDKLREIERFMDGLDGALGERMKVVRGISKAAKTTTNEYDPDLNKKEKKGFFARIADKFRRNKD